MNWKMELVFNRVFLLLLFLPDVSRAKVWRCRSFRAGELAEGGVGQSIEKPSGQILVSGCISV